MARELPQFLGIPQDFSEKSWFHGTSPSWGPTGRPVGGAPLLASGLPSLSRYHGVPSVPGVAGSGLAFRLICFLALARLRLFLWLDLVGFGLAGIWLDFTRLLPGFGLDVYTFACFR